MTTKCLGGVDYSEAPTVQGVPLITGDGVAGVVSSTLATRPAPGVANRIFVATDVPKIFRDTGSAWVLLSDGNASVVLQSLLSNIAPQSSTKIKAVSNVLPVSTDGTQIWLQAITPLDPTSTIVIDGSCYVDSGTNARKITFACFRDTTLIGVACSYVATVAKGVMLPFKFDDSPGVTTPVTYSIKAFADSSCTWYVAQGSTALYGGGLSMGSMVEVREVA